MPEHNWHFIPYGDVKTRVVMNKEGYLIDDYTKNLIRWDGIGIKYCTENDDSCESWNGHIIYDASIPEVIAKQILKIMLTD